MSAMAIVGLVTVGELVKAGGDRAELLATVHQPLHLVALPVAGLVKGRRPATTGALADPIRLLVLPLGNRVGDVAGAQRGPVRPAAVGLVPGQVGHPRAGPALPTRPSHPHGVHQPDQLAGVGVLPRREPGRQITAATVAHGMDLGGQPTS